MKKIQHSVRWNAWLCNAIEEWRKRHGHKSFSDTVNYLLACELNRRGYQQKYFEPGIYEKIKLSNLIKELPPKVVGEIEKNGMSYEEVVLKYNVILKPFDDKAAKNDVKSLNIPEFDEEIGIRPITEFKENPINKKNRA